MQENKAFQPDRLPSKGWGLGNHKRYWLSAKDNRDKLINGDDIPQDDWVYLTETQRKQIGYEIKVGDITLQQSPKKHHADIVIGVQNGKPLSVGGNLKGTAKDNTGTVRISGAPVTAIMTQDPDVKQLIKNKLGK